MAHVTLARGGDAVVIGVTSRGIFLLAEGQQVVFLSYEVFRSPLTVNLPGACAQMAGIVNGDTVHLSPDRISFPEKRVFIRVPAQTLWLPPPLSIGESSRSEAQPRLQRVAVLVTRQAQGLGAWLPVVLAESAPLPEVEANMLLPLLAALKENNADLILPRLLALLGYGRGLTPSGDDLLLGWLLAHKRWGNFLTPPERFPWLAETIVREAKSRTTTISANLIAAAAAGMADERLLNALDGILTGTPDEETCAENLLKLGSSSGVDALVGIALALF